MQTCKRCGLEKPDDQFRPNYARTGKPATFCLSCETIEMRYQYLLRCRDKMGQPLTPDDTLDRAQELFIENDLLALPVVNNLEQRKVVGIVRRFEIASAYLRHVHGPARQEVGSVDADPGIRKL